MIEELLTELKLQGVTDLEVLAAIKKIPREQFIDPQYKKDAYENRALPIGSEQTISQPYIVALMTQVLNRPPRPHKVLEIGTGSGYQAAILASLFDKIYTIERITTLSERAQKTLNTLKFKNIRFKCGDGSKGWVEFAPFDAIIVTAAAERIPTELLKQLSPYQGKLVMPLGSQKKVQKLTLITRHENQYQERILESVIFVPLITKA